MIDERIIHDCNNQPHKVKIYDVKSFPAEFLLSIDTIRSRQGKILNCACAFDIECWTDSELDPPAAYMYHWQFCIMRTDKQFICVMGTRWEEYQDLERKLYEYSGNCRLVIYVHNLGYEFQFFKKLLNVQKVFARNKSALIYAETDHAIYRCSWMLSNMTLAKFCQNSKGCRFWKKTDTYDYTRKRLPSDSVDDNDIAYDFCDVVGLCECIIDRLNVDDIQTIPLTSTGYVRRQFRQVCDTSLIADLKLDPDMYRLCRQAFRGGDVHYNFNYGVSVLKNVHSYDKKSSYPYQIICKKYPMSRFLEIAPSFDNLKRGLRNRKAILCSLSFERLRVKDLSKIAYIDAAHCRNMERVSFDNGRILKADHIDISLTDIDVRIIMDTYDFEHCNVSKMYVANYDFLPDEIRRKTAQMFTEKCKLEHLRDNTTGNVKEDYSYLYSKKKNEFNSIYGMMVQDPCADEIVFEDYELTREESDVEASLESFYKSKNNFLTYQWGVWVTAHARQDLREVVDLIGRDTVYIDSDCNKHIGDYKHVFDRINSRIRSELEALPFPAIPEIDGHKFYIGTWEKEDDYDEFKSLGAKKYCGIVKGELQITVAGLAKKKGAAELARLGGIDHFKIGQIFYDSGRTISYYNEDDPHYIEIDGCRFLTASNIGIVDATYTLGVTDQYLSLLFGDIKEWDE